MTEKVAAEQDILGSFAPKLAELNDDVLFGQIGSGRSRSPACARS